MHPQTDRKVPQRAVRVAGGEVVGSVPAIGKRTLLCASDLTQRSDHAIARTSLLAQQMDARAMFLHAVDEAQTGRVARMKVNRAQVRLMAQSERAMAHAPQDATVVVRLGKPLQVITDTVREQRPDLLVMAMPRRRRLDSIAGTTAERVIRSTRRPVLMVAGAADRAYERVVLATDLSPTSAHVARTVASMGVLDDAHGMVVHGFGLPYQGVLTNDVLDEHGASFHERHWGDFLRQEVVQELADAGIDEQAVYVATEQARPFEAIKRAMKRVEPQLLVIGVSRWFMLKRLLLGSTADEVFRGIDCDVLAICAPPRRRTWLRAA